MYLWCDSCRSNWLIPFRGVFSEETYIKDLAIQLTVTKSFTKARAVSLERQKESRAAPFQKAVRGGPGRNRTCGTRFRKPLLYPLSYGAGSTCLLYPTSCAEIKPAARASDSTAPASRPAPGARRLTMEGAPTMAGTPRTRPEEWVAHAARVTACLKASGMGMPSPGPGGTTRLPPLGLSSPCPSASTRNCGPLRAQGRSMPAQA